MVTLMVAFTAGSPDSATLPQENPSPPPQTTSPLWAHRFSSSLRNLEHISSPSFLEDGVPTVIAPESI